MKTAIAWFRETKKRDLALIALGLVAFGLIVYVDFKHLSGS